MAFDPVKMKKVLNSFGDSVVAKAKENLDNKNINASNDLRDKKMVFVSKVMPNSISLKFDLGEYGQGIDQGINGYGKNNYSTKFSFKDPRPSARMIDNILQWANDKGVSLRGNNWRQVRASAYNLSRYILENGIKPTYFFQNAYEEHFRTLDRDLVEAFGLDVDDFFEFIFKK